MATTRERFLVTGAAGCIGAWAVRLLLDAGVETVASDLSEDLRRFELISHGSPESKLEFRSLDVSKTEDFAALVRDEEITHVVHLAGLQLPFCAANPALGALVNVVGTVNLFEAARAAGRPVGIAYASSAAVFGGHSSFTSGLVGDASPLYPDSHYGVYKVANESSARIYSMNYGLGSIGLRPFIVYGPGRDQGMTSDPTKAMLAAAAGVPFKMKFGGNVLLTYAADCAQGFIDSARAAAGSGDALCLNVPGRRVGIAALVELIESVLPGARDLITWDPTPLKVPALLESPTLAEVIGGAPNRPLADGVAETITRFRAALAAGIVRPPAE